MIRANQIAVEKGWREAIDEVVPASLRQYVSDPHRADFQYLWELGTEARVLDVGAGWGAIAVGLSGMFREVVAVEGVLERAKFIQHRARELGGSRLEVVCADFLRLPLAPAQFDAVVLNGVVEWVGLASKQGDPRDLQVQFLRSVRELIKPGGIACVGIENRIGWQCFRYGNDHSGLKYTSLMPRRVADWYCRWKGRKYRSDENQGYRTYTYSLPGFRKLFREAGFTRCRAFHSWNGYNDPSILLPLDSPHALLQFSHNLGPARSAGGRLRHTAMFLGAHTGLWAQLASEFIFILETA